MGVPAPIMKNLTGLTFLIPAEAGIICAGYNRTTQREIVFVYDASVGGDIGFVGHNPDAAYSINGKRSGTTGLAAAAPCVALDLAGETFGNGVGTDDTDNGTVYCQSVGNNHAEKGFTELAITAFQKPGITDPP